MHYYQFNIADYRKDTQHLTPIEHYIYRELIDWYYLDERPIPLETQQVTRRLRLVSENNPQVLEVLKEYFVETEKGWIHARIDREIESYKAKAEASRINGSKGGRPKKPKKTQQVNLANLDKPRPNLTNNHKPLTNSKKEIQKKKPNGFTRPSIEEIQEYIKEKGYSVNAIKFFNHYESNGWKVGRNPMKSWQSAIVTWQTREIENGNNQSRPKSVTEATEQIWRDIDEGLL